MNATTPAPPTVKGRKGPNSIYPTPDSRIGRAWALAWAELSSKAKDDNSWDSWLDGNELAYRVARKVSPPLVPATMVQFLARMAKAGHLDETKRAVIGTRGVRPRCFYRVPR